MRCMCLDWPMKVSAMYKAYILFAKGYTSCLQLNLMSIN